MPKLPPPSPGHPDPGPADSPFLEVLFATLCQSLFVTPGETFVDQVRRWDAALSYTAALHPRDKQEWLRAADVTIKQFSAIHSLAQRKRRGISPKQRSQYERDFLVHAAAMQDARLRYDMAWKSRAA